MPVPDDIGVMSVEVSRRTHETIGDAVRNAAEILRPGLTRTLAGQRELWLVAIGRPVHPGNKVAAYRLDRERLWTAIEKAGLAIPAGPRVETRVDYRDGSFGYVGGINFDIVELPLALDATRTLNAVCLNAA